MKKILLILTIVVLATFFSCSNDEPITTKKETLSAKSLSEEPETYIDNIDYRLIEDKYPQTDISVLEEQLYQISMGNITPVCTARYYPYGVVWGGTTKLDVTVYNIGLGFCIQKTIKSSQIGYWTDEWKVDAPVYTINVKCECSDPTES